MAIILLYLRETDLFIFWSENEGKSQLISLSHTISLSLYLSPSHFLLLFPSFLYAYLFIFFFRPFLYFVLSFSLFIGALSFLSLSLACATRMSPTTPSQLRTMTRLDNDQKVKIHGANSPFFPFQHRFIFVFAVSSIYHPNNLNKNRPTEIFSFS